MCTVGAAGDAAALPAALWEAHLLPGRVLQLFAASVLTVLCAVDCQRCGLPWQEQQQWYS
jgi:hypothetical protein